jgi:hypothetical protein
MWWVSVALVIQHAKSIRRITSSPVACPVAPYYLSHKRQNCRKREKNFEHKICVRFSPQFLAETFLILSRIKRDTIINVLKISYKMSVILVRF